MQQAEERPPYVAFETRAVEDRTASLAQGCPVTRDVDFAVITPAGSRDMIEREVSDWFVMLAGQVAEGRFSALWFDGYKRSFELWKQGQETPESGTPVKNWPMASPAEVKMLLELRVRTVEDLANANEETILRLGMGGRALKDRAAAYIKAVGPSKIANEIAALRVELDNLRVRNETLEEQNQKLMAQVEAQIRPSQSARLEVAQARNQPRQS